MFSGGLLGVLAIALVLSTSLPEGLSDPTRPPTYIEAVGDPGSKEKKDGALVLSTILISPNRRLAVLNGEAVRPGDSIGFTQVVEIDLSGILLEGPEGPIRLGLSSAAPVKTPASTDGKAAP